MWESEARRPVLVPISQKEFTLECDVQCNFQFEVGDSFDPETATENVGPTKFIMSTESRSLHHGKLCRLAIGG